MFKTRTILLFFIKASILYGLLSLPLTFYDGTYAKFYRSFGSFFFNSFRGTGTVRFIEQKDICTTHIIIANYTQMKADGNAMVTNNDINTRYLGYIPTVLLISLILSSPVPWKRRLIGLGIGLVLLYVLILFKQWIALLYWCHQNPWLELTHYTPSQVKLLEFPKHIIYDSASTVLYFVIAIWLAVTFRIGDFKAKTAAK